MQLIKEYLSFLNSSDIKKKLSEYNKVIIYKSNEDISRGLLRYNTPPSTEKCFLFILPHEHRAFFHTNGMQFPIDIFFYDSKGNLDSEYLNVQPGIESIESKDEVKYVIEVVSAKEYKMRGK